MGRGWYKAVIILVFYKGFFINLTFFICRGFMPSIFDQVYSCLSYTVNRSAPLMSVDMRSKRQP